MNRNYRALLNPVLPFDEWPDTTARRAADFHIAAAEHERDEGRERPADAHRSAADLHVRAAFYFQRARLSAADEKPMHAEDHTRRGKDLVHDAIDLCDREGITRPEALQNTLGVSRGEGTKVGGF